MRARPGHARAFAAALGAFLLAASFAPSLQASPRTTLVLKVMTFNVRFDFEEDGQNRWKNRVDLVAECVRESKVSVVCFQEDKPDQVSDLKQRLPGWKFAGRGRNANGSGEHCSVAFDVSQWQLVESGDYWLSDTPEKPGSITWGTKYPHKVTWARLESTKDARAQVVFSSTHYDELKENAQVRSKSSACIREWISQHVPKDNLVHCGDHNSGADEEAHRILVADAPAPQLTDAWDAIKPAEPFPGTDHDFTGKGKKKRIDWILTSGGVAGRSIKIDRYSKNGRWPSDHFPLVGELE
ncbi:endonuclease/exonuclease/phosphatase family protein, partial [bacterium]|nr:endonuclease/exonuclease/phosphatase family protein [bacterium]